MLLLISSIFDWQGCSGSAESGNQSSEPPGELPWSRHPEFQKMGRNAVPSKFMTKKPPENFSENSEIRQLARNQNDITISRCIEEKM